MNERLNTWWALARPFTLTAAIVPVLVGTGFAALDDEFRLAPFLAMLVASILIQAGTNMFNEYFDYRRGIDSEGSVGIAGTLVRAEMSPGRVLAGALIAFSVALFFGLYLIDVAGWPMFAGGVVSAVSAFAYNGGPKPLSSLPLGEAQVFLSMGPIIVAVTYYAQAETLTWQVVAASLPVACLVAAILLANNLRDMVEDEAAGRRTLPIVIGRDSGIVVFRGLLYISYALVALGIATFVLPVTAALPLITFPMARSLTARFRRFFRPQELHIAVKGTAMLHARFGVLYAIGILAWLPFD